MNLPFRLLALALVAGALHSASAVADVDRLAVVATRYEQEYPVIGYSGPAVQNRVWQMQQQLERGDLKLAWEPRWGYLRSLLAALQIDVDTQVLVYSRTSLQFEGITALKPRAIYFNDDTYVGFVLDTDIIEITAMDVQRGPVFYALDNRRDGGARLEREGGRCLSCHDTYSMMGGGVPRVMVMSAVVDDTADTRTFSSASEVDDRTPLAQRWGGWYVTGRTGGQPHFGNLPLREDRDGERLREHRDSRLNRDSLADYFDTTLHLTDQSDVVALMVLEHQTFIQNLITRATFKISTAMAREGRDTAGAPRSWEQVGARDQTRLRAMIEPIVKALFFHEAAPLQERIEGSTGFTRRFTALGPRDHKGRSLREFDLGTRLFRYPLSYEIHSPYFDALPPFARDYVFERIAEVLSGRDTSGIAAKIPAADRAAMTEILIDTKPELAPLLRP